MSWQLFDIDNILGFCLKGYIKKGYKDTAILYFSTLLLHYIDNQPAYMRLVFFLSLFMISCTYFEQDDFNPAFIKLDTVSLNLDPNQGADTHNIEDVWVYADGQLLGVFPLPTMVPILVDDNDEIDVEVYAGIRNNGAVGTPFIYNLLEGITLNLTLSPGDTIAQALTFNYVENVKFDVIEGFEDANSMTYTPSDSARAVITTSNKDVRSGFYAGYVEMDENRKVLYSGTNIVFDRANNGGKDTYLELDYKNSVPFIVGLEIKSDDETFQELKIVLNEKEEWNKIYIDFTQELLDPRIDSYRLIIASDINGYKKNSGEIFLDNIKLLHL